MHYLCSWCLILRSFVRLALQLGSEAGYHSFWDNYHMLLYKNTLSNVNIDYYW